MEIGFTHPEYLLMLLAVPLLVSLHMFSIRYMTKKAFLFANYRAVARVLGSTQSISHNTIPLILRCIALICLILALSGISITEQVMRMDLDFVLAIDTSLSMSAADYPPTRLDAAKQSMSGFIDSFQGADVGIGVVSFGGIAQIGVPLTTDKAAAKLFISNLDFSPTGGTAIGDAITLSANSLLKSDKSRRIILLTDGQSNAGSSPLEAAEFAKDNNVVVNTIGIGTTEGGTVENTTLLTKLDEETIKAVAQITGGKYFRAQSTSQIVSALSELGSVSEQRVYTELSVQLLLAGIAILLAEWLLVNLKYRTLQ